MRYKLNGRTVTEKLNWMFSHITKRCEIKKSDLKLVSDDEGGVRMINRKTGWTILRPENCRTLLVERKAARCHHREHAR